MSSIQRTGLLLLIVFAVVVSGAWQAADKPQPMQRWEYIIRSDSDDLRKLGEDGWELTAAAVDGRIKWLYFKRPKAR